MKKTFNRGFTLVEVLVAAGIVALSLISVVAFVRKGQEQVSLDKHRRMARSIVERAIEDPRFDLMNYPNLLPSDSVRTGLDIIDNNMTPPLTGNLHIQIFAEDNTTYTGIHNIIIPFKKITATITWSEYDNPTPETLTMERWVTSGAIK